MSDWSTDDRDLLPEDVPIVAAEDPPGFIKAFRALTGTRRPTDPTSRMRTLRAELERAAPDSIGEVAPPTVDPAAEMHRLSEVGSHGDIAVAPEVMVPHEVGEIETGGYSAPRGPMPGSTGPSRGGPDPFGGGGTLGGESPDAESGPSVDVGTIVWVLLILGFILLQIIGGSPE